MVAVTADVQRIQVCLPGVEAAYLMGAFNNWSTTRTPMAPVGDDWWEALLPACCAGEPLRVFVWPSGRRCGQLVALRVDPACVAPPAVVPERDESISHPAPAGRPTPVPRT